VRITLGILVTLCACFGGSQSKSKQAPAPAQSSSTLSKEATREIQVGDRILLIVEGDSALTDTFTVQQGPMILLPVIGQIPLAGVHRNEVEPYMQKEVGRFFKQPVIHAKAFVRLAIEGEVAHPGYYAVPTDVVISDVLMAAGGLTTEAKMQNMKIDRAGRRLIDGDYLQRAVAQGYTLDQLGLRAGDRIYVPRVTRRDMESTFRILAIVLSIPVAIYTIGHLY
jgi:protein involved in polysaccharide export with SLBB domain